MANASPFRHANRRTETMTIEESTEHDCELHCLVLAAGESQRLGSPKQLLTIDDETLLHRVCREAQSVCPNVTVVLGAQAAAVTQAIDDLPVMRIHNPDWQEGIASSLRAGVMALPATADGVLILLCDQPTVSARHFQLLIDAWQRQPATIVASAYNGLFGVPIIFPRDDFAGLVTLSGDHGARDLLKQDKVCNVDIPAAACDIDTPADVEELQRQMNVRIAAPAANAMPEW